MDKITKQRRNRKVRGYVNEVEGSSVERAQGARQERKERGSRSRRRTKTRRFVELVGMRTRRRDLTHRRCQCD